MKQFEVDVERFKRIYKNEVLVNELENKIKIDLEVMFKENKKFICTMLKPSEKVLNRSNLPEIYNTTEHIIEILEKDIIINNSKFNVTPCIQMRGRKPSCRGNRRTIHCMYDTQTKTYEYYGADSVRDAYALELINFVIYMEEAYNSKAILGENNDKEESKNLTKLVDVISKEDKEKIEYMLEKFGYFIKEYHNTQVVLQQEFVEHRNIKMIERAQNRYKQIIKYKKIICSMKGLLDSICSRELTYWELKDKETYVKYGAIHVFKFENRNYFILYNDRDIALATISELKYAKIGDVFDIEVRPLWFTKLDISHSREVKFKVEYDVIISNNKIINMDVPIDDIFKLIPERNVLDGLSNVYDIKFILEGGRVNEIIENIYNVVRKSNDLIEEVYTGNDEGVY